MTKTRTRSASLPSIVPTSRIPIQRGSLVDRAWWLGAGRAELPVLEDGLASCYPQARRIADLARGWLIYDVELTVVGYPGTHEVAVVLWERPSAREPLVYASRVDGFRHLYERSRLCLWYPKDPPERRWQLENSLVGLLDVVAVQLFKEHYFREKGEWLGGEDAEVHSQPKPDLVVRERSAQDARGRR